ncbi:hypothetical protein PHMEG_00030510 [Phytophthora megakarya]|uniref:Uncharacterized protein n=1 Tax=Phytophthora megakarya TaxID=4795 RepID=A0A225UZT3_9STRA|nr:hypothetical protein PHMEG_00030510 [Phytophthora megakarya]
MVRRSSRPTVVSPSSQSYDSKPAAGTRRPREDDSDASSSKRPRSVSNAVPSTLEAFPSPRPPNVIPLYVGSRIVDDTEAASKNFESMTNQRRDYCISLFHEPRYWSSKKSLGRSRVPEWQALCQSWNQFVQTFNKDSTAYRNRIASARERFMKYTVTSVVQRVQDGSMNANIPCAVPVGIHCPHCPPGAPRISERDLTGYTTNCVPANAKRLRAKLACTCQHPSVMPEHNTPRNTAPRSVTAPVHGGLRTPSPFPERPSLGRFRETTYLEGEPIVSNEYENEPDLGSSSDWYGLQFDPPRGDGRSLYGQPQVDHSLQSLHARVEAHESVQACSDPETALHRPVTCVRISPRLCVGLCGVSARH